MQAACTDATEVVKQSPEILFNHKDDEMKKIIYCASLLAFGA